MDPVNFPESNFNLGKPPDMTDEQCGPLPVFKGTDTHGLPVFISAWKISQEELEILKETGIVWLRVIGLGHPPVSVEAVNPFE